MGILKKNKTPDNLDTLIGSKTIFEGILISNESICIEGTVKGKVECRGSVIVHQGGKVKADIIAENAIIGGHVTGNIKTKNRLEITSSGRVRGDIAEGFVFEGSCHMISEKSAASTTPTEPKQILKRTPEMEKPPFKTQTREANS